jgi:6-pyruvoyl-tetrahydropterin synthase
MFSVSVRDHVMISHSLKGELFGPAQNLHGATYVIDLELKRRTLDPHGVVVDIGRASALLASVLEPLRYANLDRTLPELNTTTEVMCKWVHDAVVARLSELGSGYEGLHALRVVLRESHVAQAAYEAELGR